MKRESLSHPKMLHLASLLDCNRAQAIGYVTLLINWVADYAIQGDVGKWPDGAIARACDWTDSPDAFISALTESGWLDEHPEYRLVLHDWPDHAERWVKSKLAALKLSFLDCYPQGGDTGRDTSRDTGRDTSRDPPRDRTKPSGSDSVSDSESEVVGTKAEQQEFTRVPELREAQGRTIRALPPGSLSHGVFAPLREEHLGNTRVMVEWHAKQLGSIAPVAGPTEAHLLCVIAAGMYASGLPPAQVKKTRLALFKHVVSKRRWKLVRGYIPAARNRLDEYLSRGARSDTQERQAATA